MLHMPRQLSCRGMCKIVTWLDHYFWHKSKTYLKKKTFLHFFLLRAYKTWVIRFLQSPANFCWCPLSAWHILSKLDQESQDFFSYHINLMGVQRCVVWLEYINKKLLDFFLPQYLFSQFHCHHLCKVNSLRPSDTIGFDSMDLGKHWFRPWIVAF